MPYGRGLSTMIYLGLCKVKKVALFQAYIMNIVSGSFSSSTFDNDLFSPMVHMDLECNLLTKEVISGNECEWSMVLVKNSGLLGSQRPENWFYWEVKFIPAIRLFY